MAATTVPIRPWGSVNPTAPFESGFGAGFYPTTTSSKFPPNVAPSTFGRPATGFEPWNVFEPEPWQGFPSYTYRNWPLNVSNTFGPTNTWGGWPSTTPMNPGMTSPTWGTTPYPGATPGYPWMTKDVPPFTPSFSTPYPTGGMTTAYPWSTTGPSMMGMSEFPSWSTFGATSPMMYPGMTGSQTLYNVNFRPTNWLEFYTLTNPIRILDRDGSRMLFLAFDLRGFKPEEINVTLNKQDRSLVVEANYDYNDKKEHQLNRRFYRKFVMPDYLKNVDWTKVDLRSMLGVTGTLIVEAMLPRMTPEEMKQWSTESHVHGGMPSYGTPGTWPGAFGISPSTYGCPVSCRPVTIA